MTKPTTWLVRPAKSQISMGIRPVWSEPSLYALWIAKDPGFLYADSEDSDQTGRMPRLLRVFSGHTGHFVVFVMQWFGSIFYNDFVNACNPFSPFSPIKCKTMLSIYLYEPQHDKTNKMTWAPSEDSDQPGHPPGLIRAFTVHSKNSQGPKVSSCGQRRLWSDWVDAQANLSLCLAHRSFCWFCHGQADIFFSIIWAWSCENVSYAIYEQQRCRSACASVWSAPSLFTA